MDCKVGNKVERDSQGSRSGQGIFSQWPTPAPRLEAQGVSSVDCIRTLGEEEEPWLRQGCKRSPGLDRNWGDLDGALELRQLSNTSSESESRLTFKITNTREQVERQTYSVHSKSLPWFNWTVLQHMPRLEPLLIPGASLLWNGHMSHLEKRIWLAKIRSDYSCGQKVGRACEASFPCWQPDCCALHSCLLPAAVPHISPSEGKPLGEGMAASMVLTSECTSQGLRTHSKSVPVSPWGWARIRTLREKSFKERMKKGRDSCVIWYDAESGCGLKAVGMGWGKSMAWEGSAWIVAVLFRGYVETDWADRGVADIHPTPCPFCGLFLCPCMLHDCSSNVWKTSSFRDLSPNLCILQISWHHIGHIVCAVTKYAHC